MYPVGAPFWKLAARAGVPMKFRVDLRRDEDAGVFIATSPALRGLVVESESMDDLFKDLQDCVDMLLHEQLKTQPKVLPRADISLNLGHCMAA